MATRTPKPEVKEPNYSKLTIKFIRNNNPKKITGLQAIVTEEEVKNPIHVYQVEGNTEDDIKTYTIVYDKDDGNGRCKAISLIISTLVCFANRRIMLEYFEILMKVHAIYDITEEYTTEYLLKEIKSILSDKLIHVTSKDPYLNESISDYNRIVKLELERDKLYLKLRQQPIL